MHEVATCSPEFLRQHGERVRETDEVVAFTRFVKIFAGQLMLIIVPSAATSFHFYSPSRTLFYAIYNTAARRRCVHARPVAITSDPGKLACIN